LRIEIVPRPRLVLDGRRSTLVMFLSSINVDES